MRTPELPFDVASPGWQKIASENDASNLAAFVRRVKIGWRGRRLTEEQITVMWNEYESEQKKHDK